MDPRLIPADASLVRQLIATTYLSAPAVDERLGEIILAPHQLDAVGRLLELLRAEGGAVLADATGMGKTFVALAVAKAAGRTVVAAPAALRGMWREATGRCGVRARIESYESFSRGTAAFDEQPELLVLDEAHHARNPASKRYARIADLAWGSQVLILSATPIHNKGRDVRALLALFLGSRAHDMSDDEVRRYIVRRTSESLANSTMPSIEPPKWLDVPRDRETLRAIESIPPAVPAADGSPAHALMVLGLIRAWSSSEAALRATLRRRLRGVASYFAAIDAGRFPARQELDCWPVVDDAIQLGFPALFPDVGTSIDVASVREGLVRHQEGVRSVLRELDRAEGLIDRARADHLAAIADGHAQPVVAFSQFADTAASMFAATATRGGVALVTGKGARVVSGAISTEEIVRGFDSGARNSAAMPLDLLVATDVLSEGLSLRRAGVIVHLDIPWTLARLDQRVGRLRRLGSPHRCIHVYAIGPPIESEELNRVLRALQRKARLTSSMVGDVELKASLPLFGERLRRATAQIGQRGNAGGMERLRGLLGRWARMETGAPVHGTSALVLLQRGSASRLLAIRPDGVSERPADLWQVVQSLEGPGAAGDEVSDVVVSRATTWIDEQRAHDLVRPAIDAPSAAQIGVLRALQDLACRAPRAERAGMAKRVEACRAFVTFARGIGFELALQRLLSDGLHLDALERLLHSRATFTRSGDAPWRVIAVIQHADGLDGVQAFIGASLHRGLPRFSRVPGDHAGARG